MTVARVAVLMGSVKDEPKVQPGLDLLDEFGIAYETKVVSAHRNPDAVAEYAASARDAGVAVVIAAAGKAAHLAGAVAANTTLPVIGVPLAAGGLGGLDALLSTVQMPTGIPVATVGVDAAANAALLAAAILAIGDEEVAERLDDYRRRLRH
jgi:5-(carboxyamino)imidazole ribonucleotide mutase